MKTLNFLADFWEKAKTAVNEIETELPKVQSEGILKPLGTSGKMWTIQYKDLGNSWGVKDNLLRHKGESKNLKELVSKVRSIFEKSPDKVVEFLQSVATKGYFTSKLDKTVKISLTPNELTRLRMYINENL